ncbi:MAG: hypothetical protein LUC30_01350 [Clostridiales bacterium]|nr:hypothetical protein [Clostridiales bacterium]
MYDSLWQIITAGDYTLTDIVYKINVFWAQGQLSESEKNDLIALAQSNISTDQEKPELEATVTSLAERVSALEEAVAALQGSSSGGDGDSGGSGDTGGYEEWTAWDGVSDKYQYGAIVSHNGTLWISTYSGQNVWEPGAVGTETLWQEYTEGTESEG